MQMKLEAAGEEESEDSMSASKPPIHRPILVRRVGRGTAQASLRQNQGHTPHQDPKARISGPDTTYFQ
jgi:hypothetical protein